MSVLVYISNSIYYHFKILHQEKDEVLATYVPRIISLNVTTYVLFMEYVYIQDLILFLHTHKTSH